SVRLDIRSCVCVRTEPRNSYLYGNSIYLEMKTALAILVLIAAQLTSAQPKSYSFEDALAMQATAARPMVVFIKTDWCKYCKILENTTLKNPETVSLLDEFFYFIAF